MTTSQDWIICIILEIVSVWVKSKFLEFNKFSLKNSAKDLLITSQLKVALLSNKQVSMANYQINTVNQIIFIFGVAKSESEKREVINEAKIIQDVKNIDASIFLVSELSKNKK